MAQRQIKKLTLDIIEEVNQITENDTIGSEIETLNINSIAGWWDFNNSFSGENTSMSDSSTLNVEQIVDWSLSRLILDSVIRSFKNLQRLRLSKMNFSANDSYQLVPMNENLISLSLDEIIFKDITQLSGLLKLFPGLQNLSMTHVKYDPFMSKIDYGNVTFNKIISLKLNEIYSRILKLFSSQSLKEVGFENLDGAENVP